MNRPLSSKISICQILVLIGVLFCLSACSTPVLRYQSNAWTDDASKCLAVVNPSVTIWRHYFGGSLKLFAASQVEAMRLKSIIQSVMFQFGLQPSMQEQSISSPAIRELVHRVSQAALEKKSSDAEYSLAELTATLNTDCERAIFISAQVHVNDSDDQLQKHTIQLILFGVQRGEVLLVLSLPSTTGKSAQLSTQWRDELSRMLAELK